MVPHFCVNFVGPVVVLLWSCGPCTSKRTLHNEILSLLKSEKYDKNVRPRAEVGPVIVEVSLVISSLRSVSTKTMREVLQDYQATILCLERWQDDRLGFNKSFYNKSEVVLHKSLIHHVWTPDDYFPNVIHLQFGFARLIRSLLQDNDHHTLLRLSADGYISYGKRISFTAECPMDLSNYPFDEQNCYFNIESFGHSTVELVYQWRPDKPIEVGDIKLPNLHLKEVKAGIRNVTFPTGEFTRLVTCFGFARSRGYYFVQLFVPAAAVVITTWFALWLRVTENSFSDMINLMLTITLLYFSYNTIMPEVSYVKAVDVFLLASFAMVVLALIKTAIVQGLVAHGFIVGTQPRKARGLASAEEFFPLNGTKRKGQRLKSQTKSEQCGRVTSKICGFVLPLSFAVFFIGYIIYYLVFAANQEVTPCDVQ